MNDRWGEPRVAGGDGRLGYVRCPGVLTVTYILRFPLEETAPCGYSVENGSAGDASRGYAVERGVLLPFEGVKDINKTENTDVRAHCTLKYQ